jgi:hypothetical protein
MTGENDDLMSLIDDALGDAATGAPDKYTPVEGDDKGGTPVNEADDLLDDGTTVETDPRVAAEGDDAEDGEEAVDAEGNELHRDPATGKFIKAPVETAEEKAAREAAQTAADKEGKPAVDPKTGKPVAAAKAADALNDPIPKELAQATQDRMRTLVSMVKDTTRERDELQQNFNYMVQGIQATGTTTEQYSELLSFMALFNSGDPAQQEKALDLVEGVAERLATLLGKERKITDPLSAHEDLRAEVAANKLTPQRAREIAAHRNQQKFRGDLTQTANDQQRAQQQQQQERTKAKTDLTALEVTLRSTDPQYGAKRAMLVPVLKAIFPTLPPSQWKSAFERAYRNVVLTPAKQRVNANTHQQPTRTNRQPAGGQPGAQPKDGLDVLNAALADFGGNR